MIRHKKHARTTQLEQRLISKEASDWERSRAFFLLAEELESEIAELWERVDAARVTGETLP